MGSVIKLILAITPVLPEIIADVEALAKDAQAKGESLDQRAKDAIAAVTDILGAIGKLI